MSELLTLAQAAAYLKVHPRTLTRLVEAGRVPYLNVSSGDQRRRFRFTRADLDAYLTRRAS